MLLAAGEQESRPFLATPAYETVARSSPDGRWVAYVTGAGGQQNVYVRPFSGPAGTRYRVSPEGAPAHIQIVLNWSRRLDSPEG